MQQTEELITKVGLACAVIVFLIRTSEDMNFVLGSEAFCLMELQYCLVCTGL